MDRPTKVVYYMYGTLSSLKGRNRISHSIAAELCYLESLLTMSYDVELMFTTSTLKHRNITCFETDHESFSGLHGHANRDYIYYISFRRSL